MKIGIDARTLYSAQLRGIGKNVYNIIREINKISDSIEFVLFYNHWSNKKHIPDCSRITERQCEVKRGGRLFLWEQVKLPIEAKNERVDILHSPANTAPLYQPCPTVVTLHDTLLMESDEDETKEYLFYTRKIIPFGLRKARKIITVSHNSKKDIMKYFKILDEKIEVIYNGISPIFKNIPNHNKFNKIKDKYGIRQKYIFSLGAIGPRKNTIKAIETFAILKKRIKIELQLVIAGLQKEALDIFSIKVADLGLKNAVILIGYIPDEDLVELYSSAELSLYLSLYEGFGFPAVESMACGCPVVGSNRSSIPELIADSDLLVDPTNTDEIISKIMPLIINQEYRSNKIQSCLKQSQKFNWLVTAEKTLKVYESVLNQKGERCL